MLLEKIIYSNRLNKTEYLRSLSLLNESSFLCRIYSFKELVNEINIRFSLSDDRKLINSADEEFALLFKCFENDFVPNSYEDLKAFISSIHDIRKTIIEKDELIDFKEKLDKRFFENESYQFFLRIYQLYLDALDSDKVVDLISLAKSLLIEEKIFDQIIYLKEDDISNLELELIKSISKEVKEISILELYPKKEYKEIRDVRPYYGKLSEIDGIISNILENHYCFNDVLIVTPSNNDYPSILLDKYLSDNIAFTSEFGIPLRNTPAYLLYKNIINLRDKYFYSYEGFLNLFNCPYFDVDRLCPNKDDIDNLAKICGKLKISFYVEENKRAYLSLKDLNDNHRPYLDEFLSKIDKRIKSEDMIIYTFNVIDAFKKGLLNLLSSYFIDKTIYKDEARQKYMANLNEIALSYISDIVSQSYEFNEYADRLDISNLKANYLKLLEEQYIYPKTFSDNAIHITTIDKAISTARKHIYFVDFSASSFPGKAKEGSLINDEQYEYLTGIKNLSTKKINDKNELFRKLINIYSNLGIDIHLSYSLMNIVDVNANNPASVLLEVISRLNKEEEFKKLVENARYFDNKYSSLNKVVDLYLSNEERVVKPIKLDIDIKEDYLKKSYSPSSFSLAFICPLRFYLERLKYIQDDKKTDLYDNIGFDTLGNLVHMAMEHYIAHKDINEDEFEEYINELYELYNKFDYSPRGESNKKNDYFNACLNAYNYLKEFDISDARSEYEISYQDNIDLNGICFHGSVDLLCKDKNGNLVILDYKTGKKVEHSNSDTLSSMQGIIYALLIEKKLKVDIHKAIFYYVTINYIVEVDIDAHREALYDYINQFKELIEQEKWPIAIDKKVACQHCPYDSFICPKGGEEDV